jgi:hypothetical protein
MDPRDLQVSEADLRQVDPRERSKAWMEAAEAVEQRQRQAQIDAKVERNQAIAAAAESLARQELSRQGFTTAEAEAAHAEREQIRRGQIEEHLAAARRLGWDADGGMASRSSGSERGYDPDAYALQRNAELTEEWRSSPAVRHQLDIALSQEYEREYGRKPPPRRAPAPSWPQGELTRVADSPVAPRVIDL